MNWFAKFEKKFSKYAIKNLMFYIIVLYAIGFVMNTFFNGLYDAYFSLDFAMIFKGQVWRLITFILQPPSNSIIFVVFVHGIRYGAAGYGGFIILHYPNQD